MAGPGTLIGGVVAVGVGEAASTAINPILEPQRQTAWDRSRARIFDIGPLAELVAQGLVSFNAALSEANRNGYTEARFRRAVQLALKAIPIPEMLELWRRGKFGAPDPANPPELVTHALAKAQIEPQYWEPILELFYDRLDPAVIATAIQRGIMVAPFDLPYNVNVPVGNVTPFPVSTLDAAQEAQAHGINVERLRVETALVGLPMALDRAAQAHFRGILTDGDYLRAVLEGNARGEWAQAELDVARQILTSGQYVERQLRGFTDRAGRLADTDKHGMSHADSDKLYEVLGRSPSIHTLVVGLARGGKYPGSYANVPEPYRADLQRANLREEWSEIAYAARYNYPSPFVLRSLAQAGDLGDSTAVDQILREIGWKPELAAQVASKWVPTGTHADPHITKAQNQLWTATHRAYVDGDADAATATNALTALGVDSTAIPQVLALWDVERTLIRKELTPTQLKKAYVEMVANPATGLPFTKDDVIAELVLRGYPPADATVFLET